MKFNHTDACYSIYRGNSNDFFLLIHGLGVNKTYFQGLENILRAKHLSFVNVDLPGHGFAKDIKIKNYRDIVDYCQRILDHEEIKRITPVGHSLGGFVSLALGKYLPGRVSKLVLIDSSYELSLKTLKISFALLGAPICTLINIIGRTLNPVAHPGIDFSTPKCLHNDLYVVWLSSLGTSWNNSNMCLSIMKKESLKNDLPNINCPVVIIKSAQDQIFSQTSYQTMANLISQSELYSIPSTHNIIAYWQDIVDVIFRN